jgi:MinD-like ATPase involved in chromosome partitioning or flagellar assembly
LENVENDAAAAAAQEEVEVEPKIKQKKEVEKAEKTEKKTKKVKKVTLIESTPVIKSATEDEEPFIRFKNIPLMNEINSICDVKKFKNLKKLSAGVKLARQILDI